jgi:hypothetical protein
MKLRLQFNSIRLRLKRSEVERFAQAQRIDDKIISGTGAGETFYYLLEAAETVSSPKAIVTTRGIIVQVPLVDALRWAATDEIGIEGEQPIDDNASLRILIEKDFACLDGTEDQNADTFPNPLAGLKC